ncbi:MAG: DUF2344 domain-containing protein [Clostridia bacterium]|nr:DUF2344 domain-containing protein [Clostridia bacterium]
MVSPKELTAPAPTDQNAPFWPVRFRLTKDGPLVYISHLDFVRTIQKALVRAGLPLWYTRGYNPIPKITFAAPLSIGMSSECELMDVRMDRPVDPAGAQAALAACLPPHVTVTDAYLPTARLSEIGALSYDMRLCREGLAPGHVARAQALLDAEHIYVEKKGKAGLHTVDIRPLILSARLCWDEPSGEIRGRLLLSASPSAFLSPESVLSALRSDPALLPPDALTYCAFHRVEVYTPSLAPFR